MVEMTRPAGNVGILPPSSADFKKIISDLIIEYHLKSSYFGKTCRLRTTGMSYPSLF